MQRRASQPTSMKRGLHLSDTPEILQAHYWTGKQNCEVMDMICLKWETVSQCKIHACNEVWLLVSECQRKKKILKWIKAHLQTKEKVLAWINYLKWRKIKGELTCATKLNPGLGFLCFMYDYPGPWIFSKYNGTEEILPRWGWTIFISKAWLRGELKVYSKLS